MTSLTQKAKAGILWSAIDRFSVIFVQLPVSLILARLLGPEAYGLIGMLTVFIALSQTIVDGGMREALIRKMTPSDADCATVFYFNTAISLAIYLLLYISAPAIADFFRQPELVLLLRVLGITVIINSFSIIQSALLSIIMDFKTQAKASFLSVLVSATVGLTMAFTGYGVWALVAQTLTAVSMQVILLNLFHFWRPQATFSKQSFNELFGFGSKLLLSGLLDTFFQNIYQLIIGRQFNSAQVGFFTQARNLVSLPATTLTSVLQSVTYPLLSSIQDDLMRLDKSYLLIMQIAAVVMFPLFFGLAFVANDFILLLLGERWQPTAVFVAIIAFGGMLYPIHAINLNFLKVKGRSDLFLKLEIIKKVVITLVLLVTVPLGVEAICIGMVGTSYFALVINTYYNGKLSSLGLGKQLLALFPIWLIALVSCFVASTISKTYIDVDWLRLFATIFITAIGYVALIRVFQKDIFITVYGLIFKKVKA